MGVVGSAIQRLMHETECLTATMLCEFLGQRPGNHRLRGGGVGFLQLLLQIDGDFFDLTTEFKWDLVREIHRRASVFADVECFVERDADWHRSLDASLGDLFTINA